jgi:hypothetical protein
MIRHRLKRKILLISGVLLLIYVLGYGVCRYERWIVHYTASADGKCAYHDVSAGDYKLSFFNPAAALLFTPLRYAEVVYWKLRRPINSAC